MMAFQDDVMIGLSQQEFLPNPPGNILAHSLKNIHDDSKSVFPDSVYKGPTSKTNKYKSIYRKDYLNLAQLREQFENGEHLKCKSVLLAQEESGVFNRAPAVSPAKSMFSSWNVPDRITSSGSQRSRGGAGINTPGMPPLRRSNTELPQISSAMPRPPSIARSASIMAPPPRVSNSAFGLGAIHEGRVTSPTRQQKKTKMLRTSEVLDPYYQPAGGQHKTAMELLQGGGTSDNYAVKKALELMAKDKNVPLDRDLQKWMMNASQKDRAVAQEFFESLTGSQLLGGDTAAHQDKVQEISRHLRKGKVWPGDAGNSLKGIHHMKKEDSHLRFIRLLTPQTRANKWMHQTWHHLPSYRDDDPVQNRSSIYTEPNKLTPRHFVIHPDLG